MSQDRKDRGVDLDLREVLGGDQAPDLVEAVLRRHAAGQVAAPQRSWRRLILAACLLLGVGAVVATAWQLGGDDDDAGAGDDMTAAPRVGDGDTSPLPLPEPGDPNANDPQRGEPVITRLDNGVRVLIWSVPGVGSVGMETMYDAGFLHEPAGMTQASHLLEHLMCNGATGSYEAGASFGLLETKGTVNAETLPDFAHYDYLVEREDLELCLQIEAERLSSLRIDRAIVEQEVPRCYRETDFVERNPRSGMLKHAFMAYHQGWRYGRDEGLVRGGMEAFDLDDLRAFHGQVYRPSTLTVVLVGDVDPKAGLALVKKHLGGIEEPKSARVPTIDWGRVAKSRAMTWDVERRAMCLAWAPPRDAVDRLTLSMVGQRLYQELAADRDLAALVDHVSTSNWMWSVGELPFYVHVMAKDGVSLDDVEKALRAAVADALATVVAVQPVQLARQAEGLHDRIRSVTEPYVGVAVRNLIGRTQNRAMARGMVLGQSALNWFVAERALGGEPARTLGAMQVRPKGAVRKLVEKVTGVEPFVTRLVPR